MAGVGLLVGAIGLAGCSSGSQGAPPATAKAASSVLIRQSDLPSGWESNGVTSSTTDAQTRKVATGIPACKGFVAQADLEKSQIRQTSESFKDTSMSGSSQNEVSNSVTGYKSEDLAKTAYGVFASAATETCLNRVFRSVMRTAADQVAQQTGVTPTIESQVDRLGVPAVGDATTAYEVSVKLTVLGQSQQVGFVLQLVRSGSYVVSYDGTLYQSMPKGFTTSLVNRTIARLEAAAKA